MIKESKYHIYIGSKTACTKRVTKETKGLGQRDTKGSTKDCFLFDRWFYSKMLAESVIDVDTYMVGMIKNNTKLFCKYTIYNLKNYWPRGYCLVLKRKYVVPGDRHLTAIG